MAGDEAVVDVVEHAESVFVPFVVVAELRCAFGGGRREAENQRTLHRFLAKPGVGALFAGEATLACYVDLFRQLRTQGTPIPTHDVWIAALVVEHGLTLFSRDAHFDRLPQLNRI